MDGEYPSVDLLLESHQTYNVEVEPALDISDTPAEGRQSLPGGVPVGDQAAVRGNVVATAVDVEQDSLGNGLISPKA